MADWALNGERGEMRALRTHRLGAGQAQLSWGRRAQAPRRWLGEEEEFLPYVRARGPPRRTQPADGGAGEAVPQTLRRRA